MVQFECVCLPNTVWFRWSPVFSDLLKLMQSVLQVRLNRIKNKAELFEYIQQISKSATYAIAL